MISEKEFSIRYTSFWQEILPMGEDFIRLHNLELERFAYPLESNVPPENRSAVNEMAFRLFSEAQKRSVSGRSFDVDAVIDNIADETLSYIKRFPEGFKSQIGDCERRESKYLMERMEFFFRKEVCSETLLVKPIFAGCGRLGACEGDVIFDGTICEIKSGERKFRILDLRQTIIYAFLDHMSQSFSADNICLMNPRTGVYFTESIQEVVEAVSGINVPEFYARIADFVCEPLWSR